MIYITIDEKNQEKRIDLALADLSSFSRSMIQKLIYNEKISCQEELIKKPNTLTKLDQVYCIIEPEPNFKHIVPEAGEMDILFEDQHIIVLNKPAELIVHPGVGNPNGTLINRLAHYCQLSDINGLERLGVVHRLDKGVSGCIIFAKTNAAHINLSQQFQERTIHKTYIALCYGKNIPESGVMEDLIGRSCVHRKKMAITESGKHSIMEYRVENYTYIDKHFGFISQIKCLPKTGRMHQIRVQLASRRLPIIGDKTYGNKQYKPFLELLDNRIALHACSVEFTHPIFGNKMKIEAAVPKEFEQIMQFKAY